jgi:hemerythrin
LPDQAPPALPLARLPPADMPGMSMFQWKQEYSVGYPEIDKQHQKLFQLADELHAAMTGGKGKAVLGKTLGNLISYTKVHFANEEGLMQRHGYPDYPKHKALHDALTAKVVAFQKDFEANHTGMTVDLLQFLKDWLAHHIGQTDQKVATYFKSKAA